MKSKPQVIALTFTYPGDAARAALYGELLPKSWRRIWCVEPRDAGMPTPDGVELLVRPFKRGGTLRGAAAVFGMKDVYLELSRECDVLVKIDSDTALFRPDAFTAPAEFADVDFTYIRRYLAEGRLFCNGCCYAMSREALSRLSRFFESGIPEKYQGHEDLIFSTFFAAVQNDLTLCQIQKSKVYWAVEPYLGSDVFAAHFGYVSNERAREDLAHILSALGRDVPDVSVYQEKLNTFINSTTGADEARRQKITLLK